MSSCENAVVALGTQKMVTTKAKREEDSLERLKNLTREK